MVTHDALVASCAQREIMLNHGVLVGEKWNDEDARKAYEAAGGKPASTGAQVEGAQNGETAIGFADPPRPRNRRRGVGPSGVSSSMWGIHGKLMVSPQSASLTAPRQRGA